MKSPVSRRSFLKASALAAAALVLPTDEEVRRFWPGFGPGTNSRDLLYRPRVVTASGARTFTLDHPVISPWDAAWLEMTRPRPPWRTVVLTQYAMEQAGRQVVGANHSLVLAGGRLGWVPDHDFVGPADDPVKLLASWSEDPDEGTDLEMREIAQRDKHALFTAEMLARFPDYAERRLAAQGVAR